MPKKPRTAFQEWLIAIVVFSAAIAFIAYMQPRSPQTVDESASRLRAEDLRVLVAIHEDAAGIANIIDRDSARFLQKWDRSAKRLDFYGLYDAAEEYTDIMRGVQVLCRKRWSTIPVLHDANVAEHLSIAMKALFKTLSAQVESGAVLMSAAGRRELRPSALAKLRRLREDASGYYLAGTLSITKAYEFLGVEAHEVDLKNGGLKQEVRAPKPRSAPSKSPTPVSASPATTDSTPGESRPPAREDASADRPADR